jgi:hypothetical protein
MPLIGEQIENEASDRNYAEIEQQKCGRYLYTRTNLVPSANDTLTKVHNYDTRRRNEIKYTIVIN